MQSIASNGSPLNQWFRQQGSTKTKVLPNSNKDNRGHKSKYMSKILNLPCIINSNSTETLKPRKNPHHDKASLYTASHSKFSLASGEVANESEKSSSDLKLHDPHKEQSNLFYSRCIEDVIRINEPQMHIFDAPKELTYVQSIPYLKYVTYGSGKAVDCIWQIEVKRNKFSRKKI